MNHKTFIYHQEFPIEYGDTLAQIELRHSTLGIFNANRDNVSCVYHTLTADSNVADWCSGLVDEGKLDDPKTLHHLALLIQSHHKQNALLSLNNHLFKTA